MSRWTARLAVGALCAAVLLSPAVWLLRTHVPIVVETPLLQPTQALEGVPIELSYADYPGSAGRHAAAMMLRLDHVDALVSHQRLDLLVGTYETAPHLLHARLAIEGTDCTFDNHPGAAYPNNGTLALLRSRECARMTGTPTGRLRLEVTFERPGRLAIWTYRSPAETIDPSRIYLTDPTYAERGVLCALRGRYIDEFGRSPLRRVDLLAYVWQVGAGGMPWIWLAMGLVVALVVVAALVIPSTSRLGSLRASIAAGCAALAIATLYAVVVPPFQAADEPSHFRTLLTDIGRPELANEATAWSRRVHFERIHFHPDERFRPGDVTTQGAPWNDDDASALARGIAVRYLWRAAAPVVRSLGVGQVLLAMRILHGLIFAIAVGSFVLLVTMCTEVPEPRWLALPLFLIPTLPFFGMNVSNYGPLTSVYVVLGAGVMVSMFGGPKSHYGGVILGLAFTLAIAISRSALPLTPFVASVLIGRILTGGGAGGSRRSAMLFWTGIAMPICCGVWLLQSEYFARITLGGAFEKLTLAAAVENSLWLRRSVAFLVGLAGLAGYVAERVAVRLRRRLETRPPRWTATPYVAGLLAALTAGTMAASLVWTAPVLDMIDPAHPPAPVPYVRAAVSAGLTFFRPASPDFLTSVAFWQGFGWLDTIPSVALASLLASASGVAFVCLLLWVVRTRATRVLVWIYCTILGYAATFAAYAFSVIRLTPADLHGRYLLGLYLCMLLIVWSGVARLNRRVFNALPPALGVGCVVIHAYCLAAILQRYF